MRFFDIFFASIAVLLLLPIFIPIAVVLKFTGEGEILYYQERIGKEGNLFSLIKFATMLKNSPQLGTGTVTIKNDSRVLPFGFLLRATKINELPQLLNVIRGDMSLVGPRPQTSRCFQAFPEAAQNEIVKARPGLSGIGSIVFRGEEHMLDDSDNSEEFYDNVIMPYKGDLEQWYVQNANLSTYFIILFLTVYVIVTSNSSVVWRVFPSIPYPPEKLREHILGN
jgi:lipopolysaccharide/colanic/teichoic acid biosynthesis glycosyltransferase